MLERNTDPLRNMISSIYSKNYYRNLKNYITWPCFLNGVSCTITNEIASKQPFLLQYVPCFTIQTTIMKVWDNTTAGDCTVKGSIRISAMSGFRRIIFISKIDI